MAMAFPVTGATLFGAGMVIVGIVVLLVSLRYVWRTSRVWRAPAVTTLADVAPGTLVRITGTVHGVDGRGVAAPFSGRSPVAIRASVEERRLSPYGLPWFVTIWETQQAVPFAIRTAEADVSVGNPVRTVVLGTDEQTTVGAGDTLPERIAAFAAETPAIPGTTVWRDPPSVLAPLWRLVSFGTRRYREAALAATDEVTVVGRCGRDGTIDPLVLSDRSPGRTFWRMARTSLGGLIIGTVGVALGVALLVI
jgi:hypothetical protein